VSELVKRIKGVASDLVWVVGGERRERVFELEQPTLCPVCKRLAWESVPYRCFGPRWSRHEGHDVDVLVVEGEGE
jgi:hypothetical protein